MTPKEKAEELVLGFKFILLPFITYQNVLTENDLFFKCKQCASKCVDEVIKICEKFDKHSINGVDAYQERIYYQQVKQEIEKL